MRMENNRRYFERKAAEEMRRVAEGRQADWGTVSPNLDDAIARLSEKDRDILMLRYAEELSLEDTGALLASPPRPLSGGQVEPLSVSVGIWRKAESRYRRLLSHSCSRTDLWKRRPPLFMSFCLVWPPRPPPPGRQQRWLRR